MSSPARHSPRPAADVCVIGAGPAGALTAARLARRGHSVVVLEAGPRFEPADRLDRMRRDIRPAHDPSSIWETGGDRDAFTSAGPDYYPVNRARVKGVGGTTLHWQGMVMRLHERDFEKHTRDGVGEDWPIDYADLQSFYAEAERELDVAGAADNPFDPPRDQPYPLPAFPPSYSDSLFAEACEALEIATHSVPNARNSEPTDGRSACVGYGTCQPVCPSGAKYVATRHIEEAETHDAQVIDRAPVQRINHNSAGTSIESVTYATPTGNTFEQEARHFVLAAGGLETPRLLLLSKSSECPNGVANSSGLVGRYFFDHLFAGAGGIVSQPTRQNHIGFNTMESHQFYDSDSTDVDAIKLEFFNYAGPSPVEIALQADHWGDDLLATLKDAYGSRLGIGALVEQAPRRDSYVTLDHSKTDDHGNPVPEVHWSIGARERTTIRRANTIQHQILDELGAKVTWTVGPADTGPAFHHMGTTRMGVDPAASVVNPRLRTHDHRNLWIVSSSVFVTGGAMNPTLTIAALALRAADTIHSAL